MAPVRVRRTQAERAATTRRRLLEATVACLNEHGYAGATSKAISERAGVSRGAQLHHFPTKADLVVATIEHVFNRSLHRFREAMRQVSAHDDRLSASIDLLWEAMSAEDTRHAWIELVVGTRPDPVLHQKVVETTARLSALVGETFAEAVDPGTVLPEVAPTIATALMDGLLIMRIAGLDDGRIREVLDAFKRLGELGMQALAAATGESDGE